MKQKSYVLNPFSTHHLIRVELCFFADLNNWQMLTTALIPLKSVSIMLLLQKNKLKLQFFDWKSAFNYFIDLVHEKNFMTTEIELSVDSNNKQQLTKSMNKNYERMFNLNISSINRIKFHQILKRRKCERSSTTEWYAPSSINMYCVVIHNSIIYYFHRIVP